MNSSQMFKFTQLRPVNGIDVNKIRKKHIPLYREGQSTKLLIEVQKLGLPAGLTILNKHIQTTKFNTSVNSFNELYNNAKINEIEKVTFVLQKAISFSQTFSTLKDKDNANLKHLLQETRAIKNKQSLDIAKLKKEVNGLNKIHKDDTSDNLYALLLQSAYYPEYRRHLEVTHKFISLCDSYGVGPMCDLLFPDDTSLSIEEFDILRIFFSGRILLPNNVETDKKPLPLFKNKPVTTKPVIENHATEMDVVKGTGFTFQKLKTNLETKNSPKTK